MNSDAARRRICRLNSLPGLAVLALPGLAISSSFAAAAPATAQAIEPGTTARTSRESAPPPVSVSNRTIQAAESSQEPPAGAWSKSVAQVAGRPSAPPAPPTPDMLLGVARRITEAWIKGDPLVVERHLSDRFVDFKTGVRVDKKGLVAMVGDFDCALRGWKLHDPQTAMIDPNVYVLSYQGTFDGSCKGPDGKSSRMLSPHASGKHLRPGGR